MMTKLFFFFLPSSQLDALTSRDIYGRATAATSGSPSSLPFLFISFAFISFVVLPSFLFLLVVLIPALVLAGITTLQMDAMDHVRLRPERGITSSPTGGDIGSI